MQEEAKTSHQRMCSAKEAWLTSGTQVQQPSFMLCHENTSSRYLIAVLVLIIGCSLVKIYFLRRNQQKTPCELWLLHCSLPRSPLPDDEVGDYSPKHIILLWNGLITSFFIISECRCDITLFSLGIH